MTRLFLLAFALAAPATIVRAQPQPQAAPVGAVDQALIERFMAALPRSQQALDSTSETNAELLALFTGLNPGRDAEVRPLVESYARCAAPALREGTLRMFGALARDLGRDKVEALIRFYSGPDFTAFARVAPAAQAGTLAPADAAELARLLGAYPLADFHAAMRRAGSALESDEAFTAGITRCATELRTAMQSRRLRVN